MGRFARREATFDAGSAPPIGIASARDTGPGKTTRTAPGWRLTTWLLLFGGCLVAPALGFAGILIERHWAGQQREIEQRLEQVAADLTDDVDRFLESSMATLSVIAETSDFSPQQLPRLHDQAARWLGPLGLHLVFRDAGGQQLMNTRVPWGSRLPASQQPDIDPIVRATLKPHVSDVIAGTVAGQAIVTVTVPVMNGPRLTGFLHMSIDPQRLLELARGQFLPPQWVTGISDRKGVIVTRLQEHERYVGTPLPEELQARSRQSSHAFHTVNVEGIESVRAARVSRLSGWLIWANVPLSVARAPLVAELWSMLGAGLVLLALMVALAFTVARFVSRPIQEIARFGALVEDDVVPPMLASPLREANEVSASLQDAAERLQERTRDLQTALDRFAVALRGADIVVFAQDLDRRLTWISDTAASYPAEIVGSRPEDLVAPDPRSEAIALKRLAIASGQAQDRELKVGQGEEARFFRVRIEPMRDHAAEIVGLLGVSSEVTAHKRAEERNEFLLKELAHRSKNLLAVVQAIAVETLRSGPTETFGHRFASRLRALGSLHDLTVAGVNDGVELGELVTSQLAPFAAADSTRLRVQGPSTRLKARAANAIGMALHELATNAAKYGALSNRTGTVAIDWSIGSDADEARRFRLQWRESGGPPVVEPERRGFGRRVLVEMAAAELLAEVSLTFPTDGAVWNIDAPAVTVEQ